MFSTRERYFPVLISAVCRESSRLTEMHKLSHKRPQFTCFILSSSICSGVASRMTLGSVHDLEVIYPHPKLLHAKLCRPRFNGSRVT